MHKCQESTRGQQAFHHFELGRLQMQLENTCASTQINANAYKASLGLKSLKQSMGWYKLCWYQRGFLRGDRG